MLYPLAGLDPATAAAYDAMRKAQRRPGQRRAHTIADAYFAGRIDRADRRWPRCSKYAVSSKARAEQRVKFMDTYRAYMINYGIGQDAVKAYVERVGKTPAERWKAFEALLSEPTLPVDLK